MNDQISNDAARELKRLEEQVALEVLERAKANLTPEDEARSVTKEDVLMAWSEMIPRTGSDNPVRSVDIQPGGNHLHCV